jgi:hypothetical protein
MGTICEAIASRKPLLLVNYPTPEGRAKFEMLQEILGNDLPFRLDIERPLTTQIADWLDAAGEVSLRFATIPCDGAATVARALPELN